MRSILAALALSLSVSARAQDQWPPPLPALARARPVPRHLDMGPGRPGPLPRQRDVARPPGEALDPKVAVAGIAALAEKGPSALRMDAARARDWSQGREGLRLVQDRDLWGLLDSKGAVLSLSPALGSALRHMNAYFGMTGPTLARPVTREDLAAAFAAPSAIEDVAAVFERSIDERLSAAGKVYLPELGGELTLDRGLAFHFLEDPQRPTLRELVANSRDPAALARIVAEHQQDMARLDPYGLLARHLETRRRWDAEDRIPRERRDATLRMVVDTVVEQAAGRYSGDASTQLKTMTTDDWSGRYAGPWHCHPPDVGPDGWTGYYPPSEADYEAAAKNEQEIVIAFHPDGFDVYELSEDPKGAGFMNAKPFYSHRSPSWRERFQARFLRLSK